MRRLTINQGRFHSLAYTADGSLLAALDSWGTLHFWETTDWVVQGTALVPAFWSDRRISFSADGRHGLVGGRTWDLEPLLEPMRGNGALPRDFFGRARVLEPHCLAFSPDGAVVARCTRESTVTNQITDLGLWDTRGRHRVEFACLGYIHRTLLHSVAFAPDGQTVAATQVNYSVRLWDVNTGIESAQLEHTEKVHAVVYAPHGRLLATAAEGVIRLWDPRSFRCVKRLRAFKGNAMTLAFHPGGKLLAAGGQDGTVRIWELPACRQVAALELEVGPLQALAFSPDGNTTAAVGDKPMLAVWEVDAP
jgi:WD40 repeat protein